MNNIRRVSDKEVRKAVIGGPLGETAPAGLPPILRASWKFARNMSQRFNRELIVERLGDFLKQLGKKFVPPKSKTVSRKELEDRIIEVIRAEFMKYSDETLQKYDERIKANVRWYVSSLPRHIASSEAHDLEAEAKMAFMECLKTWDPRKGELWPYVSFRLKGAMQDYLRKRGGDPVAGIYDHVTAAANVYMAFNNKHIADEGTLDKSLHLESALKDFPEKERAIIVGYYQQDKTFKEIGKDIGLSESQVSRICKEATIKLKACLIEPAEPLDITDDIMKRRQF